MKPEEPTLYQRTSDMVQTYLDKLDLLDKKAEKWYFRPSLADFNYLFHTVLTLIRVAIRQAAVIDSDERVIEGYKKEVAALEREIGRRERTIFDLNTKLETISIKNQAKEEK